MIRRSVLLVIAALLSLAIGCNRQKAGETTPAVTYPVRGQVVALEPASSLITLAHEKIPGFMEAMTMPFSVRDTAMLRGIDVGDTVTGVLVVRKPEVWLDSLSVVWKMSPDKPSR